MFPIRVSLEEIRVLAGSGIGISPGRALLPAGRAIIIATVTLTVNLQCHDIVVLILDNIMILCPSM